MDRPAELPALTAVRFFAALAVLVYHFGQNAVKDGPEWLIHMAGSGYVGVPFFFLLSGFILVYVSQGREIDYRGFMVRRIARIYPVYLLAWALFGLLHTLNMLKGGITAGYWLKSSAVYGGLSLTLLQSWIPGAPKGWNGPGWSLSCEMFFYLLFPLAFFYVGKLKGMWLWVGFAAFCVLNIAAIVVALEMPPDLILFGTPFEVMLSDYLYHLPPSMFILFLMGVALGHLYIRHPGRKHAGPMAAVSIAVILVTTTVPAQTYFLGLPRDAFLTLLFCALIYSLASIRFTGFRFAVLLGQASYGMYILQLPLWDIFWSAQGKLPNVPKSGLEATVYVVFLIGACILIYQYFERLAEKWVKVRFSGRVGVLNPVLQSG